MAFVMKMLQQPELLERLQWYPMGSSALALEVFYHCHALVFFFSQTECAICVGRNDFVLLRC